MLQLATIYSLLENFPSLFGGNSFGKSCHASLAERARWFVFRLKAPQDVANRVLFLNYSYMLEKQTHNGLLGNF